MNKSILIKENKYEQIKTKSHDGTQDLPAFIGVSLKNIRGVFENIGEYSRG